VADVGEGGEQPAARAAAARGRLCARVRGPPPAQGRCTGAAPGKGGPASSGSAAMRQKGCTMRAGPPRTCPRPPPRAPPSLPAPPLPPQTPRP
jgi:hypothetical protein